MFHSNSWRNHEAMASTRSGSTETKSAYDISAPGGLLKLHIPREYWMNIFKD